jgi:hypothetical protein
VVEVNSSCSSTAVQQGDSQDLHRTGQDGTKRRRDTGQGKAADETGRGRRAGNGAGTELKRGGCAMPSSSAPCQPASSRQSSPPVKSKPPTCRRSARPRGQAQGTAQGSDRRRSEAERVERAGQEGRLETGPARAPCVIDIIDSSPMSWRSYAFICIPPVILMIITVSILLLLLLPLCVESARKATSPLA